MNYLAEGAATSRTITDIIIAVLGVTIAFVAYLSASRQASLRLKAEKDHVDAEAYTRAREIYESSIKSLEDQIESLRDQLKEHKERNDVLRRELDRGQERLAMLEEAMRVAGIPRPDHKGENK